MSSGLIDQFGNPLTVQKAVEGQYRPGPWLISEGWLPADAPWNWWQAGIEPRSYASTAIVEACVSAYAQTIAMCPGSHWLGTDPQGRERVKTSSLSRVLKRPNPYQTWSDFMLNSVRSLFCHGNMYALALRNDRQEITSLHWMDGRESQPRLAVNGELFFHLSGNPIVDYMVRGADLPADVLQAVPARDVLHVKLASGRNPLVGESPLTAVALDLAQSAAMSYQNLLFYQNQARPAGVLQTDQSLTKEQIDFFRERWYEASQGMNAGKTPVLHSGLKWNPVTAKPEDAQFVEVMKLTDQRVALIFGIPLAVIGLEAGQANTEAVLQQWKSRGLGFALNHIEQGLDGLFKLSGFPDEYVELDTMALLRSNFKDRIEGLARAVQGGILSPNEAREQEGFSAVEFGDEPRVQQQVVPLSAASGIPSAPPSPGPSGAPGLGDEPDGENDDGKTEGSKRDAEHVRLVERIRSAARHHVRTTVAA